MRNIVTASITDLIFRKATKHDYERFIETNVEGLDLDRFDCDSPNYHLRAASSKIEQQYEVFLTDPRRI